MSQLLPDVLVNGRVVCDQEVELCLVCVRPQVQSSNRGKERTEEENKKRKEIKKGGFV